MGNGVFRVVISFLNRLAGRVTWVITRLDDESAEIKRVAKEIDESTAVIKMALAFGRLETLTPQMWARLENTDSNGSLTVEEAVKLAEEYERPSVHSLIEAMRSGGTIIPAPIVLELPDGTLTLVAGNTRLMVARALGITPKVWFGKLNQ